MRASGAASIRRDPRLDNFNSKHIKVRMYYSTPNMNLAFSWISMNISVLITSCEAASQSERITLLWNYKSKLYNIST